MQRHPFTARQMFQLQIKTLEKRIENYYCATADTGCVIKLARLLQIRRTLGTEAFQNPCEGLIRKLYLTETKRPVEMKRYLYYFRAYFSNEEWALLLLVFFPEVSLKQTRKVLTLLQQLFLLPNYRYTVP